MDIKLIFSILGVATIFIGEVVYIKEILKERTKPHPFTWLGWSLLTGLVAKAQIDDGGGAGFAILAFEAMMTFIIFLLALKYGEKKIFISDYISFGMGIGAVILWKMTSTPFWSVILITVADALMFMPTIRKTFLKPFDEELFEYYTSSLAYALSFFALVKISLITFLYPGTIIILNSIFIIFTLAMRKHFKNMKEISVLDIDLKALYGISLKSAQAKEKVIYIYEKYSLNELLGEAKGREVSEVFLKNKVKVKQITNDKNLSLKNVGLSDKFIRTNIEVRFVPKEVFDIENEVLIFDDTVAIYDDDNTRKMTIFNNSTYAKNQKQLFKVLWKKYEK
jgi:hypothetical protein